MNTDSPNTGAKIKYDLIYSRQQLIEIIHLLSQLAAKYSWKMNITDGIRYNIQHGLNHEYGIVYWCHIDPIKKSIMFCAKNINKNLAIGSCSSPTMLSLCAELYIINGCNSEEYVTYPEDINTEFIPELTAHNKFASNTRICNIYTQPFMSWNKDTDLFDSIDTTVEYLHITLEKSIIYALMSEGTPYVGGGNSILVKKAYMEELLGCNFEEFCRLVPNNTYGVKQIITANTDFISIGGHVFDWKALRQHADINADFFYKTLSKTNHSVCISRYSNIIFKFDNGIYSIYKYFKPSESDRKESTIDRSLAYTVKVICIQQDKIKIKSFNILKEGITIKIEENEKFN